MINPTKLTDEDIDKAYGLMTPKQRRKLQRMSHGLWKLLTTDAQFAATEDRYVRQALRHYWTTVIRVTRTAGPDYRIQFPGQQKWIRATPSQYQQAAKLDFPHCEVPAGATFTPAGVQHILTA